MRNFRYRRWKGLSVKGSPFSRRAVIPDYIAEFRAFVYHCPMKLEINTRGNGACPICAVGDNCRIQKLLCSGVEKAEADGEMEIVVYTCPYFSERRGA